MGPMVTEGVKKLNVKCKLILKCKLIVKLLMPSYIIGSARPAKRRLRGGADYEEAGI